MEKKNLGKSSLLLAALLLSQMILPACGGAETPPASGSDTTASDGEATSEVTTEEPEIVRDFGGKPLRVLMNEGYVFQIYAEEENGDLTNDAIFRRNQKLEEKYNFTIEPTLSTASLTNFWTDLNTVVLSGDDAYDLAGHYAYDQYKATAAGTVLNWLDVPNVNLDKPWWVGYINDAVTINNKLFGLTGFLSTTVMQLTYAFYYNIDICKDYGVTQDSLYKAVYDGKWTIDYLDKTIKDMYKDLDNDGKRSVGDQYGFGTMPDNSPDIWLAACNQPITKTNSDGKLEVVVNTEKSVDILNKLLKLYYTNEAGVNYETLTKYVTDGGDTYFAQGLVGFIPSSFLAAFNTYRDTKFEYGILPIPKYDDAQEKYYSHIKDKYTSWVIPVTEKDTDFVGFVVEALCKETYETVYPIFYDTALKNKYTKDADTAAMVDLIMDGVTFDPGWNFGTYIGSVQTIIRAQIKANDANFASAYASKVFTLDQLYDIYK